MKSMRKYMIGAVIMIFAIMLTACGQNNAIKLEEGKINVVTTIFPIYDFAKQIGGDHANVMNLIPTGVEPHDWTPKSQEISVTSKAQLLLYNGAGLEGWIPNFLQGLGKDTPLKTVEVSHGIDMIHTEGDDGHHHDEEAGNKDEHDHVSDGAHGDDMYLDPHTWVSPKSALIMAKNIKDSFIAVDAANQADYETNYAKLEQKLKDLDSKFETELAKTSKKEIVVSHQAFGYLARDYGLTQKAVMGLSPEAEPRSQDIIELTKYVKEHNVKYIFFEELVSDQIAKMLASEAKVETMVLNPIEGLTPEQDKSGENYVTLMERNLQNLVKALQ
ncbi:metal ABC transporter solute-binding protein, Zn/Mn family [Paenibacillus terrigena]|uniref:metal ABC transporter substrate-binding protein n=1 Tax=Paenibacillus terrigena TaxID=369333 RepID=UPI0028D56BD3|nr:zinc ABC transporter substrate-binding protein [Paenibacillus terrigena]